MPSIISMDSALTILCLLAVLFGSYIVTADEVTRDGFESPLANSVNDFGFKLTNQIGGQDNLFISPLSVYMALALVHLGAGGQTAQQLEAAFELQNRGLSSEQLHEVASEYLREIRVVNNDYSLLLANGIFLQQNFSVEDNYIQDIERCYNAMLKRVNFLTDGEAAKNEINGWVADSTNNKISEFLSEPLDTSTVMAILNAIYFKGTWKTQFSESLSFDGTFYKNNGDTKTVKYMIHRQTVFRFFEDVTTSYKFLELPYKGDHISMLLALPTSEDAEPNLVMTNSLLRRINNTLASKKLQTMMIPKFKMEFRRDLKSDLSEMGITDVFTPAANLSGIRKENDLFVSEVKHASIIEVNEEGSEAAAVTGVFITRLSAISFDPEFVANHPFLFYIFDRRNGMVLFSGRLSDP